jgi:hypothetical protein
MAGALVLPSSWPLVKISNLGGAAVDMRIFCISGPSGYMLESLGEVVDFTHSLPNLTARVWGCGSAAPSLNRMAGRWWAANDSARGASFHFRSIHENRGKGMSPYG